MNDDRDKIKVWVQTFDLYRLTKVYVGNNNSNFTLDRSGQVTEHIFKPGDPLPTEDSQIFLKAPTDFVLAVAEGFAEYVQRQGGLSREQLYAGKIQALEAEILWLRSLIDKQLTPKP